jgi:cation transport ATPase
MSSLPPHPNRTELSGLLSRGRVERCREHRYRFSQAVVFGLPVLGLELFGRELGGAESARWVGLFQALLSGWVVYVAAAGMLFEGALLLWTRRRMSGDMLVAVVAAALYLHGLISVGHVLVTGTLWYQPLLFHVAVGLLAVWSGLQWWRLARRA